MSAAGPEAGSATAGPKWRTVEPLWSPLIACLLAERARWPVWLPVFVGIGILAYFRLPTEPSLATAVAAATSALAVFGLSRGRPTAPFAIALLACAVGFAAAKWRTEQVAAPVLSHRIGPLPVEGRVVSVTERAGGGASLVLDSLRLVRRYPMRVPERIKLTMRAHKPPPNVGDRVRLLGVLMPPPSPAAPGAYDFARTAWFQRIGAVGYVLGAPKVTSAQADRRSQPSVLLTKIRHDLSLRARAELAEPAGPIAAALLTGDRSGVAEDATVALRDAGLAHLLSISGLHMAMFAGTVFFIIRAGLALIAPIALRWPIKKWAAVTALLAGFAYLLLSGASYPTQRSFLMTAAALVALMVDRTPISMRILAVAAAVLLLVTPEAALSVSFQFSFAAVAALIALYEALGGRFAQFRKSSIPVRALLWLVASLASGLACELALAPIAAYQFNRLAIFGALANLVAIPLFGFWIMPAGVLALVLLPFGLAGPVLAVMGWGIDVLLALAYWVSAWPNAVIPIRAMPVSAFALMSFGMVWLLLWERGWRWFGLVLMALGIAVGAASRPPDILIEREGKLVAARNADGDLVFSSLRRGRFARNLWLRRDGRPESWKPPKAPCEAGLCAFTTAGRRIVYLPEADGACPAADVVISPARLRSCPSGTLAIDRATLARGGAQAIWLTDEGVRIVAAQQERGERPWARTRVRFRNSAGTTRSSSPAP